MYDNLLYVSAEQEYMYDNLLYVSADQEHMYDNLLKLMSLLNRST